MSTEEEKLQKQLDDGNSYTVEVVPAAQPNGEQAAPDVENALKLANEKLAARGKPTTAEQIKFLEDEIGKRAAKLDALKTDEIRSLESEIRKQTLQRDALVQQRTKILQLRDLVFNGSVHDLIDKFSIEGWEDADPDLLPSWAKQLFEFTKSKLRANASAHEDGVVEIFKKYLTEADVDVALTYNTTPTAKKMREHTPAIVQDLMDLFGKWNHATLEPHFEEIQKFAPQVEPAPLPATDAETEALFTEITADSENPFTEILPADPTQPAP